MTAGRMALGEIAARVVTSSPRWSLVVAPDPADIENIATELKHLIGILGDMTPLVSICPQDGQIQVLATDAVQTAHVIGLTTAPTPAGWQLFDQSRERARATHPRILVANESITDLIPSSAPHFWSWLDSAVYRLDVTRDALSADERERRLISIRTKYADRGLDDRTIVEAVRSGTAPEEPDIAEWLVLLGHGSLLVSES